MEIYYPEIRPDEFRGRDTRRSAWSAIAPPLRSAFFACPRCHGPLQGSTKHCLPDMLGDVDLMAAACAASLLRSTAPPGAGNCISSRRGAWAGVSRMLSTKRCRPEPSRLRKTIAGDRLYSRQPDRLE